MPSTECNTVKGNDKKKSVEILLKQSDTTSNDTTDDSSSMSSLSTFNTKTASATKFDDNIDDEDYTKYIKEDLWIPKVRWIDLEETWDLHINVLEEE